MIEVNEPIPISYKDTLHEVFDLSPQGFQLIGFDWRYLYINKAAAKHGRITQSKLLGRKITDIYSQITYTTLFTQLKRAMTKRISIKMENEFTFQDGKKGWFQLYIHPCADGLAIFSVDITQRKLAEKKLADLILEMEKTHTDLKGNQRFLELKQVLLSLSQSSPEIINEPKPIPKP